MINMLNKALEKFMPLLTPSGVILGLLFSAHLHSYSFLAAWIFAGMSFAGSLGSSFKDLGKVLMHPMPIIVNFVILHLFMPLFGWAAGTIFFPGDDLTQTGFVLLFVIPTGVISLLWVTLYKGNMALTLALILLDTLLSPLVVPFSLSVLVGAKVQMDVWHIMQGLLFMVVVPSLLGMAMNQWTKGNIKVVWGPRLAPFSKIGLFIVVALNSAVVAPFLSEMNTKLIAIMLLALVCAPIGYLAGWAASVALKWQPEVTVALTFNSGMRNLSAGAVLAVSFFPPPVALPVIAGMLFQQIIASLYGQRLGKTYGTGRLAVTNAA
ncbi:bile acid:sodium symporter family protein [Paenibacillus xerothermodurans]|uniref:Bile acid:sodium symporter family protein n=1 Tax=Paenibacillus xerothermodurans TaxID=1977292 RepID=A0A2W1NCA3_PAEXE|nr:bile acid:sodium symporter family protein [Paenibacillus xerothermodurans]PZE22107.1 bile acid:sodium symporter family protein [Paenibacillus xerothermodurans]